MNDATSTETETRLAELQSLRQAAGVLAEKIAQAERDLMKTAATFLVCDCNGEPERIFSNEAGSYSLHGFDAAGQQVCVRMIQSVPF